jgi:ADP-heptose:LPS heptosyltransferase
VRACAARGRVTFLAGPAGAAAARLLPGVEQVLEFAAPWVGDDAPPTDPAALVALTRRLAGLRFDAALVLTSFHQSPLPLALLLRAAGVARLAATSEDHPGSLLDARVRYDPALHEVEQGLAVAAALGFTLPEGDAGDLAVGLPPGALPPGLGGAPYVVVHPGASVPARGVPAALARDAVAGLARRGWQVVVTGGPGERDLTAAVAGPAQPAVHDLGGALDLAGLARVLAGADALVVGNTGPAHLAAAVSTPVAQLFAPVVSVDRWRPYRVPSIALGDLGIACGGCRARRCPLASQACIADVTPADVVSAVEALACGGGGAAAAATPTAAMSVGGQRCGC